MFVIVSISVITAILIYQSEVFIYLQSKKDSNQSWIYVHLLISPCIYIIQFTDTYTDIEADEYGAILRTGD